jgi:hypothetical protein
MSQKITAQDFANSINGQTKKIFNALNLENIRKSLEQTYKSAEATGKVVQEIGETLTKPAKFKQNIVERFLSSSLSWFKSNVAAVEKILRPVVLNAWTYHAAKSPILRALIKRMFEKSCRK